MPFGLVSADPGQLLAVQHVDDAPDAKKSTTRDLAGGPASDFANYCSGIRHRMPLQDCDGASHLLGYDKGDKPSLIRHMQRIEAE
jgi:hypothetical protein